MIRVLHVITRLVRGGAQENTVATVLGVDRTLFDSYLATGPAIGPEGEIESAARERGARIIPIPHLVREVDPLADVRALIELYRVIRRGGYHIVHTHTSKAGILGRVAARMAGVPIVVHTPHGHVFHSYHGSLGTTVFLQIERWCARLADRIVMLTETEKREHLALGVAPAERFATIHSGVDLSCFRPACSAATELRRDLEIPLAARVIGTVGRLVPVKGQQYLIEALPAILRRCPEAYALIVGDGPLAGALRGRAAELGVASRVCFAGLREDVPALMNVMDLFCLPSLNEGMGRVLVEAMSCGLPVVATRVSGIPDVVVDGLTGLLVPARDSAAVAAAIVELLDDPPRARRMGDAGRARVVPAFSVGAMLERLDALYRELVFAHFGDPAFHPPGPDPEPNAVPNPTPELGALGSRNAG